MSKIQAFGEREIEAASAKLAALIGSLNIGDRISPADEAAMFAETCRRVFAERPAHCRAAYVFHALPGTFHHALARTFDRLSWTFVFTPTFVGYREGRHEISPYSDLKRFTEIGVDRTA